MPGATHGASTAAESPRADSPRIVGAGDETPSIHTGDFARDEPSALLVNLSPPACVVLLASWPVLLCVFMVSSCAEGFGDIMDVSAPVPSPEPAQQSSHTASEWLVSADSLSAINAELAKYAAPMLGYTFITPQ